MTLLRRVLAQPQYRWLTPRGRTMRPANVETLLTVKDVAAMLSISVRSAALNKIPKPIRLARQTSRWKASQLQEYMDKLQLT
jgi:predicted DNA-binding transcriptional regulator AlpA